MLRISDVNRTISEQRKEEELNKKERIRLFLKVHLLRILFYSEKEALADIRGDLYRSKRSERTIENNNILNSMGWRIFI